MKSIARGSQTTLLHMINIVFDIETDGLIHDVSTIWCASFCNVDTKEIISFTPDGEHDVGILGDFLQSRKDKYTWICHNMLKFDREVFKLLLGVELPLENCQDTLLWSYMLYPDIPIPKGCKGKHGLDTWGTRFGIPKPKHEDWSRYTPEMLHRNQEDVKINTALWLKIKNDKSK
jgi:hypothetical protein